MHPLPLPLVDGCFFIDHSTLEYVVTCSRSSEYFILNNRISALDKPALNFGSALHLAFEHRYAKYDSLIPSTCFEEQANILTKHFSERPNPIEDFRQPSHAQALVAGYNKKYFCEEWDVVETTEGKLVEKPFACLIGTLMLAGIGAVRIIWTGKIDLVVRLDNLYWTVDHKTTSMMGRGFFEGEKMSAQHPGYCWAAEQTLKDIKLAGFIVNGIRTRAPNTTEKGKTQRADVVPDDFQRFSEYLFPGQLTKWRENTLALIEEFFWHYQRGFFPEKRKWCMGKYGRCPYYEVCELPHENRQVMLESGLFANNDWSPLKQTKNEKL